MSSKRSQKYLKSARSRVPSRVIVTRAKSEDVADVSKLLRLPVEMIHHILMYLDARNLFSCTAVCHTLQDIVKQSPSLQYHIELFSDHLVPGGSPRGSHAELLRRLFKSRTAWDHLTPTSTEMIELDRVTVYEIRDGLWLSGKPRVDTEHIRTILMLELPASTHLECRMQKTLVELEFEAADVTVMPSQDLLVVLQDQVGGRGPTLHLRTISENKPHPVAAKPVLESPHRSDIFTTVLYGDNIALANFPDDDFGDMPGAVVWWNWKTGDMVRNYPHGSSSVFLSSTHLAVLVYEGHELAFHIISSEQDATDGRPLCTLSFPCYYDSILFPYAFASDRAYSSISQSSPISRDRPVRIDSTSDLICIQVCSQAEPDYLVFFRRSTLLERAINLPKVNPTRTEFKWEHWGPEISRWVEAPDLSTYEGCIHGLKFVTQANRGYFKQHWGHLMPQESEEDSKIGTRGDRLLETPIKKLLKDWKKSPATEKVEPDDGVHLFMLDFNPRPIARGFQSFSDELADHCVVEEETLVQGWGTKDVISRMPFRAVMSKASVGFGFADAVVEGENVVGIGVDLDEQDRNDIDLIDKIHIMTF